MKRNIIASLITVGYIIFLIPGNTALAKEGSNTIVNEPAPLQLDPTIPLYEGVITIDPSQCLPNPCTVLTLPDGYEDKAVTKETDLSDLSKDDKGTVLETEKAEVLLKSEYGQGSEIKFISTKAENCIQDNQRIICKAESKVLYDAEVVQEKKVLGFFPVKIKKNVQMDGVTGNVIFESSHWMVKTFGFLFD